MYNNFKSIIGDHIITAILTFIGVGLLITSAIIPPPGIIDSSMLAASTLTLGFAGLWTFIVESRQKGRKTTFEHNGTKITNEIIDKE